MNKKSNTIIISGVDILLHSRDIAHIEHVRKTRAQVVVSKKHKKPKYKESYDLND